MDRFGSTTNNSKIGKLTGLDAATVTADVSVILGIDEIDFITLQLHVAAGGNLAAAPKVLISNSYQPNPQTPQDETTALVAGNWVDITASCIGIVAIAGAGAQEQMIVPQRTAAVAQTAGRLTNTYVKLTLSVASGSGVVSGWFHGRGA